jgi:hypothetical protein
LTIQFAYQRYETIYEGKYNLGATAASLLGIGTARALSL